MPGAPRSLFISYSRTDSEFVDRLEADLKARNFYVWVDRSKMEGGQDWMDELERAVDRCQVLLVVLSPEAMDSKFVKIEYRYAFSEGKPIIPLNLRPTKAPAVLQSIHWIDFHRSYDQGLTDLLNALSHLEITALPPSQLHPNTPNTNSKPPAALPTPPSSSSVPNYTTASYSSPYGAPDMIDSSIVPARSAPWSGSKTPLFPTWFYAFCLLVGVGASVGTLSQSWPWAIGTVTALALFSYALGYHREMGLKEARNIILISVALVLGITLFLSTFQYNLSEVEQTDFGVYTYTVLYDTGLAVGLGAILGVIDGIALLTMITDNFGSQSSPVAGNFRKIAAWIFLGGLLAWLLLTLLLPISQFWRGPDWGIPILTGCVVSFIGGIGLIISGYICWKALTD